jgi:hypothetical protein
MGLTRIQRISWLIYFAIFKLKRSYIKMKRNYLLPIFSGAEFSLDVMPYRGIFCGVRGLGRPHFNSAGPVRGFDSFLCNSSNERNPSLSLQ